MRKLIAAMALTMIMAHDALAQIAEYNVSGVPTARSDGSPLPANEIAHYKLYERVNGELVNVYTVNAWPFVGSDVPDGTITATVSTVDTEGREGHQSPAITVKALPSHPDGFGGQIVINLNINVGR